MSNRSKANRPIHVLDRARPTYRTLMDMHADGPSD